MLLKPDQSPTARALLALELVQGSPGITADRLADKLGVSERAARRYVGILREAGIPIESVRGPFGGYRLGRGLRLPPLMFSAAEALGLVMAVLDGHHDASDPTDPVGSALGKIMRALPEPVAAQAEAVRRATAPAPDRAAARPDPGTTTTLVQACSNHRQVRLDYRSEAGSEWVMEVDPWAVVVRHGRWYLLCRTHARDARRAYRIDRVRAVEVLDGTYSPPAELDPVAMLEEHLAVGWEYDVEVVIDAPFDVVARCLPRTLGVLKAIDGQTTRLVGSTSNPVWYVEQLVRTPAPYRIVGCRELQESARVLGQRLLSGGGGSVPGMDQDDAVRVAHAYVESLEAREWERWTSLIAEDVVYEMPQSRERIRGRAGLLRFNMEFPGDWHLSVRRVIADGSHAALWLDTRVGDERQDACVWLDFSEDGLVSRITDYWPEAYDPPAGREHLVERW